MDAVNMKPMPTLPDATVTAITLSVNAMVAPLAIPQTTVDGALAAFFDELSGRGTHAITDQRPLDRILTAKQTAELLARSKKTVCSLAKRGKIRRVCLGANGQRASGYSEQSVREFLAGKEVAR